MALLDKLLSEWPAPPIEHLQNLHVLLNPVSGAGGAPSYFSNTLEPFLSRHAIPYALHRTTSATSTSTLASTLKTPATIIILSGDGTLHELLSGLSPKAEITFIPIPHGTANALYHSLFRTSNPLASLASIYSSKPKLLPLAQVALNHQTILAHVVVSTALHASILFDSDKLRESTPGIERFKKAAQQNWGSEYPGRAVLKDAKKFVPGRGFVDCDGEQDGPWSYLNCCLTDRLEDKFVVATKRGEAEAGSIDVVGIRRKGRESKKFFQEMVKVFAEMYDEGKHVDLVWHGEEMRTWQQGNDPDQLVVDYWRCSGLDWTPVSGQIWRLVYLIFSQSGTNERSRLLCIDGAIHSIKQDQSCSVNALAPSASNIKIWA